MRHSVALLEKGKEVTTFHNIQGYWEHTKDGQKPGIYVTLSWDTTTTTTIPRASPGSKGIPEYSKFWENGVLLLPGWPEDGGGGGGGGIP